MQTQNVVTDKEREIRKRDLEDKDRKKRLRASTGAKTKTSPKYTL